MGGLEVGGVCVTQQGCCSPLFPVWEVNVSVGFVCASLGKAVKVQGK